MLTLRSCALWLLAMLLILGGSLRAAEDQPGSTLHGPAKGHGQGGSSRSSCWCGSS